MGMKFLFLILLLATVFARQQYLEPSQVLARTDVDVTEGVDVDLEETSNAESLAGVELEMDAAAVQALGTSPPHWCAKQRGRMRRGCDRTRRVVYECPSEIVKQVCRHGYECLAARCVPKRKRNYPS